VMRSVLLSDIGKPMENKATILTIMLAFIAVTDCKQGNKMNEKNASTTENLISLISFKKS